MWIVILLAAVCLIAVGLLGYQLGRTERYLADEHQTQVWQDDCHIVCLETPLRDDRGRFVSRKGVE